MRFLPHALPRTGLEPPRSFRGPYWGVFLGARMADHLRGLGKGTSTGHEENLLRYRAYRGCYSPHGCGEAGERLGSLCAIEVEGLKRRPPTEVGGLGLEFRSLGFRGLGV